MALTCVCIRVEQQSAAIADYMTLSDTILNGGAILDMGITGSC